MLLLFSLINCFLWSTNKFSTVNVENKGNHEILTVEQTENDRKVEIKMDLLKNSDLQSEEQFLIFIYYDKNRFKCPNCEYFKSFVPQLDVPVKFVNFAGDVFLGSKLMQYEFPSFVMRKGGKSYKIVGIKDGNHLVEIINNFTGESENAIKFKNHLEPGSALNTSIAVFNIYAFKFIDLCYFILDYVPEWVFSFILCFVIIYLVYSIIEVIRSEEKQFTKQKKE
ncbi:hypothetical protein NUSPORA_01501 [Nucleospora cyclopteri]